MSRKQNVPLALDVRTAPLAFRKRTHFITKKRTFDPLKNSGGAYVLSAHLVPTALILILNVSTLSLSHLQKNATF